MRINLLEKTFTSHKVIDPFEISPKSGLLVEVWGGFSGLRRF